MACLVVLRSPGNDRHIGLGLGVEAEVDGELHPYPDPRPCGRSQDPGDLVSEITVGRPLRTENHDLSLDELGALAMEQAQLAHAVVLLASPPPGSRFEIRPQAGLRGRRGAR